jgi:2-polyprenyl-3-methyl-5-hydroxy-6-metoxy-1,4-benzoquinol methylase
MSEFKQCIVCDGDKLTTLIKYSSAYLCRCNHCGMVFSSQNPTLKQLEEHYKGYGRNDYLSPITIKRYNEILEQFEKVRKTNRLLDVGCGIGYFLEVAKSRGWEVFGTEYTDDAIRICQSKGIQMHQGILNPENYSPESFDVITSFEVIEHINTPNTELSNILSLLRKGGYFYVTTPNFNSLLRYYLGPKYNVIGWPEHLSYYTPATLSYLLKKHGLKKVYLQSTGISITRFITSKQKPQNANQDQGTPFIAENTSDEKLRNQFEKNEMLNGLKSLINATLTFTGKGDALKALFLKP